MATVFIELQVPDVGRPQSHLIEAAKLIGGFSNVKPVIEGIKVAQLWLDPPGDDMTVDRMFDSPEFKERLNQFVIEAIKENG